MKKNFVRILVLMCSFILFASLSVSADDTGRWVDFGYEEDVAVDKQWEITFSDPMMRDTLHNESVYVKNENGEKLFLATYLNDARTTLSVLPPADYYNPGETYTLYIEAGVESEEGYQMLKGYKKTFTIDPNGVKPDITPDGDPNAEYFGTVTTEILNVRSGPGTNYEEVGEVYEGQVVPVYDIDGFWAETKFNQETAYIHKDYLKLRHKSGKLLEGINIVIDAGHGGTDTGAISDGTYEKNLVLPVTLNIEERLELLGANVILTRDEDYFLTLDERVRLARSYYNDLFVSIHANSFSNSSAFGAETYYSDEKGSNVEQGYFLAIELQNQMTELAEMYDRGVKEKDFRVIYKNESPAALVELGFVSNPSDLEKLRNPDYQELYADAVTQGIINYYKR